ncbi:MAG: hypothetical protein RR795_01370 [Cetobacterium sp.]|uniref:hypothetical protein n=1 Tax=Cetobacterium sp. TaxID=2071632 RepID=UPI002FC94D91
MIKFDFNKSDIIFDKKNNFIENSSFEEDSAQRINFKLLLDKGDWILGDEGIPWSSEIFKIKNKDEQIKLIDFWVKKTIEDDIAFDGWIKREINIDDRNRGLKIIWEINSKNKNLGGEIIL